MIVLGLLLFSAALRLFGVVFGVPTAIHPDEPIKFHVIGRMIGGDNPGYYRHPSLMLNAATMLARLGLASDPSFQTDFASIILPARRMMAVVGALCILPVFRIGALLGRSMVVGFATAALLAFAPLHVTHSRYVKEDVFLCAGILLSLWGLMEWRAGAVAVAQSAKRQVAWLALAAVGAGLAAASKYIGCLMVPICMIGIVRRGIGAKRLSALWIGIVLLAAATFAVGSPQSLQWRAATGDIAREWELARDGRAYSTLHAWQWPDLGTWWLRRGIIPGLTLPVVVACGAGAWIALRRGSPMRRDGAFLLGVTILWYAVAEASPNKLGFDWERYALPAAILLLPFGGIAVNHLWRHSRLGKAAALIVLLCPLAKSIAITAAIEPDTRRQAAEWLEANRPKKRYKLIHVDGEIKPPIPPKADIVPVSLHRPDKVLLGIAKHCDAVCITEFHDRCYDQFPALTPDESRRLRLLREEFPQVVFGTATIFVYPNTFVVPSGEGGGLSWLSEKSALPERQA